tara:strand:- start:196 stop:867 length:672 start_codon:yes stop_codon:yes gene_type:complete
MSATYFSSSIGRKQMIAVTGIVMVLFLFGHLSGNLLIFKGPDALNGYSEFLHSLGGLLWVARLGLIGSVLLHIGLIVQLVLENRRARPQSYYTELHADTRSWFTKTMRLTGVLLLVYIVWHLVDYTFTPAHTLNATVNGEYLGLYGLVYNSFLNPVRSAFYLVSMLAVGFHLSHGIQSVFQTFGLLNSTRLKRIKNISVAVGVLVTIGYASIPIYVMIHSYMS